MGRDLLFSVALAIVLISSSTSPVVGENIDQSMIGVEVGDWFVHELIQGTFSLPGNLSEGEASPGDLITSTVTGFVGDQIKVHTEHKDHMKNYQMNMSNRLDSYIVFTDWDYWEWQMDQSWNWGDDFFTNQTVMDEADIAEGSLNYSIIKYPDTLNSTMNLKVLWNDGSSIDQFQRLDFDLSTGVLQYVYVNLTENESTGPVEISYHEQRLVDQGHTDNFPWINVNEATGYPIYHPMTAVILSVSFITMVHVHLRKRKS